MVYSHLTNETCGEFSIGIIKISSNVLSFHFEELIRNYSVAVVTY